MRQDVSVKRESVESRQLEDFDGVTGVLPICAEVEGVPSHDAVGVSWRSIISSANPYYQQEGLRTPTIQTTEVEVEDNGVHPHRHDDESPSTFENGKGRDGKTSAGRVKAARKPLVQRTKTEVSEARFGDLGLLPARTML